MLILNRDIFKCSLTHLHEAMNEEVKLMVMRAQNGLEWVRQDDQALVGKTPKVEIYREGKFAVKRYFLRRKPVKQRKFAPVLLIPPLGVKPYIYDLLPGHSLIEYLLRAGFPVYLVDFGEPEPQDEISLERYITEWIPKAVGIVRRHSRRMEINLLGYCLGGLFTLIYTAWARDQGVRNLIVVGAPFDLHIYLPKLFLPVLQSLTPQVTSTAKFVGAFTEFQGSWIKWGFKTVYLQTTLTKYLGLLRNLWDPDFVKYFSALQCWTEDFINYPIKIVPKMYQEFMVKNSLMHDTLILGGEEVRISRISCPVLVFAGESDFFGLPASAKGIIKTVSSLRKEFHLVRGGHLGVITGKHAPQEVWSVIVNRLSAEA